MLNQYVKRYQEKPSTNIHVDVSTNLHVDASTEKRDFAYKLRFYKKKIV